MPKPERSPSGSRFNSYTIGEGGNPPLFVAEDRGKVSDPPLQEQQKTASRVGLAEKLSTLNSSLSTNFDDPTDKKYPPMTTAVTVGRAQRMYRLPPMPRHALAVGPADKK